MATLVYPSDCVLDLRDGWIDPKRFERALLACGDALAHGYSVIVIRIGAGCFLMIDVIVRLLSLCNQVIAMTKRLRLEFAGGNDGVMGYLDRIGFFDCLHPDVEVTPGRPLFSGAALYRGANRGLIEIERFNREARPGRELTDRFALAVERACSARQDGKRAAIAIPNIVEELINNVCDHSGNSLDAYAALQAYPKGNRVTIAVSDSGLGIMGTLRPALAKREDPRADLCEVDLLVELFREGISSSDEDRRGLGLCTSAESAIRYRADLDVRLLNQRVLLKPSKGAYLPNMAYSQDKLSLLWGTHISFSLDLS